MSEYVQHIPANRTGRDFYMGDVHGAFNLVKKALKLVNFNPACDRLFVTGDLINRGKHSDLAMHYLSQPWFFSIKGNHEEIFIDNFKNGFKAAKKKDNLQDKDYSWIFNHSAKYAKRLVEMFKQLPVAFVIDRDGYEDAMVHGNVLQDTKWKPFVKLLAEGDKKTIDNTIHERHRYDADDRTGVMGIYRIFLGHTPLDDGTRALGNCHYIDTGAYLAARGNKDHSLTIIDADCMGSDLRGPHKRDTSGKITVIRPNRFSL